MKLTTNAITEIETNNTSTKSHTFEIGDPAIVIDILRNRLYSNPIQTLVQEYISNARDANREIKSVRPIEITLPTEHDLTFKVRDFGPGMSAQRVSEVFTKYGNSTKRNDNTQTGGFGIGAKSAWAYTDAFTVISYYNNTASHYIAHITKDRAGSLDLVSENQTNEINGVEIQIPIQLENLEDFNKAIFRATDYWQQSEYPKFTNDDNCNRVESIDVLGDFETIEGSASDEDRTKIVIDGIPYPMPYEFFEWNNSIGRLNIKLFCLGLLHFKTGQIEVSASREAVTNTPENEKLVLDAAHKALKDIENMLSCKIIKCSSLYDTLKTHHDLCKNYSHDNSYAFMFNNNSFILNSRGGLSGPLFDKLTITSYSEKSRYGHDSGRLRINIKSPTEVDFRTGKWFYTDDETNHAHQNRRIRSVMGNDTVYIISGDLNCPDLKSIAAHLNIPATSTMGPAKAPRKSTAKTEADDVLINIYAKPGSSSTTSKIVNLGRNKIKYVYAIRDEAASNNEYKNLNRLLTACEIHFCLVSESTSKKVINNSNFVSFDMFLQTYRTEISPEKFEKLLNTFKAEIKNYDHRTDVYKELSKENILDAELLTSFNVLGNYNRDNDLALEKNYNDSKTGQLRDAIPELVEYKKQCDIMNKMFKKYILLEQIHNVEHDNQNCIPDLVIYLNAVHARGKS